MPRPQLSALVVAVLYSLSFCVHTSVGHPADVQAPSPPLSQQCPSGEFLCPNTTICVPAKKWCSVPVYKNPYAPIDERVANVVSQISMLEKVGLLQTNNPTGLHRLGIPDYTASECLHGYCTGNLTTIFPQSITLAASFNTQLLYDVGTAIGVEARAYRNQYDKTHNNSNAAAAPPALTCFAPNINIARDPRWGRAQETYGEDPHLTSRMAVAYITGVQGPDPHYVRAIATPKHFNAYGGATSRGEASPTIVYLDWRDQIETFLPAFKAAITEAKAQSTMCAYNTICHNPEGCPPPSQGVPCCASYLLLTDILRTEWKFDGYVVSDCFAVKFIWTDHYWADTLPQAAADGLTAGTDWNCGTGYAALINATDMGLVQESQVDLAVSRLLRAQIRLGFLDPPELNPYTSIPFSATNSKVHRALALQAGREGIVLLTNANNTLPLSLARKQSIAVVGPNAKLVSIGNYHGQTDKNVTALDGIRALVPSATYAPGCPNVKCNTTAEFAAAVKLAANADVTIAVMGIDTTIEYETGTRGNITLPGFQTQLLQQLKATGTTLIVVLMGGSAMAVPWSKEHAAALVYAGYGGEEAGNALADVLFGMYNPAGRLPYTMYTGISQLPPFFSYNMTQAPGRTYRYLTEEPLFHFGYGLSYSRFTTTDLQLSVTASPDHPDQVPTLKPCQSLKASVTVTNVGDVDGDEVTQLYVSLSGTVHVAPLLSLQGFTRTPLAHGNATSLDFELTPSQLAVVDDNTDVRAWVQEPCNITICVGGHQPTPTQLQHAQSAGRVLVQVSPNMVCGTAQLVGSSQPISQC